MYCSDAFRYTRFARRYHIFAGRVFDASGPVADMHVHFAIDGRESTVFTDEFGRYAFRVHECARVVIWINVDVVGITVCPEEHFIHRVCRSQHRLDFFIEPIVPPTPPTPPTPDMVQIAGTLFGTGGAPVGNATISYTANGQGFTVLTDAAGGYFFNVDFGSNVVIVPPSLMGFDVMPANRTLNNVTEGIRNQDFVYVANP